MFCLIGPFFWKDVSQDTFAVYEWNIPKLLDPK